MKRSGDRVDVFVESGLSHTFQAPIFKITGNSHLTLNFTVHVRFWTILSVRFVICTPARITVWNITKGEFACGNINFHHECVHLVSIRRNSTGSEQNFEFSGIVTSVKNFRAQKHSCWTKKFVAVNVQPVSPFKHFNRDSSRWNLYIQRMMRFPRSLF